MTMITKEQAKNLVKKKIDDLHIELPNGDEIIILEQETIEKPWGWVFFYTSRKWFENSDDIYAIAGNAPILVEKATRTLFETGTAYPIEHYISQFEQYGDPNH